MPAAGRRLYALLKMRVDAGALSSYMPATVWRADTVFRDCSRIAG